MASPPVPTVRRPRSFAGPIVLIILGVVFLLGNIGVLTWANIFYGFARYWPVLLIVWGVVKLLEYFHAQRSGYAAAGIGAGGVFLLVFVVFFGLIASTAARHAPNIPPIDIDGEQFTIFGTTHTFQEEVEHAFTPGDSIEVNGGRGEITVIAWDEPRVKVVAEKRVRAGNENEARNVHEKAKISISQLGRTLSINAPSASTTVEPFKWSPFMQAKLQIYAPRKADVKVQSRRGAVSIEGRDGQVDVNNTHGSVTVRDIKGNARVQLRHGDITAEKISGDFSGQGRVDDTTVNDVTGSVTLLGDYFGETRVARVGKSMRFSSSRTEMETGPIQGELRMESDDLRASQVVGLKIHTRSKDIHLEAVSGNVDVATRNANVEVHAEKPPLGNISISNDNGPIHLYLPSGSALRIEAKTRNGDIQSDFEELKVDTLGREAKLTGLIGSPGARAGKVQLTTEQADIEIRKRG